MTVTPVNGSSPVKFWQVVVGQLPWVLTIFALGTWYVSKFDARLFNLERAVARIEVRQEQAQAEELSNLKDEVLRLRKALKP